MGNVAQPDLEATLNCGVGMVALVAPDSVDAVIARLAEFDLPAWVAGEVDEDPAGNGTVEMVGQHRGW